MLKINIQQFTRAYSEPFCQLQQCREPKILSALFYRSNVAFSECTPVYDIAMGHTQFFAKLPYVLAKFYQSFIFKL